MAWKEIYVTTTESNADALSDLFLSFGAEAVTFQDGGDQPIFEPSTTTPRIWAKTIVVGLFDHQINLTPLLHQLTTYHIVDVPDEDWVRKSLNSFKPMKFGKKLWICPSWQTPPPEPEAIHIILDPGLAFGTGAHPTTSLCLTWLEENIQCGQTVIDYGCGSGILGIAALKLGAKRVFAVDHDSQALEAATRNSHQNGFQPPAFTTYFPDDLPAVKADIVVANILAHPLIKISSKLALLTEKGGTIVLSGLLSDQIIDLMKAYQPFYDMEKPAYHEEWVRLVGFRANNN